ncbi:Tabersonine 6,7-epoxidase isoform 2 [Goodea atripinnis]|uniref:Tabersonine 6,7-epoxidase isoform 2 n=1 Tax=Goodea atripinnis TaxID=208336 RepID=A0ABV0PA80_9TELE
MYHATLTHSVYVRLEGSVLRLSKPNRNISRRAAHNEPKPDVTYISQKIYDLSDSRIYLMPQSLARKRVWNKKYPICIELAKQEDFMSKAEGERSDTGEERTTGLGEKFERMDKVERSEGYTSVEEQRRPATGGGDLTIYLFGRTGREKEEWFRRFLQASQNKSEGRGSSLSGICKSGETISLSDLLNACMTPTVEHFGLTIFLQSTPHSQNHHYYEHVTALQSDLCVSLSLGTTNPLN